MYSFEDPIPLPLNGVPTFGFRLFLFLIRSWVDFLKYLKGLRVLRFLDVTLVWNMKHSSTGENREVGGEGITGSLEGTKSKGR